MKKRIIGLSGAAIWLVFGSSFSFVMSLSVVGRPYFTWGTALAAAVTVALVARAIRSIRVARRWSSPARTPEDFRLLRSFLAVFIGEIVALVIAYRVTPDSLIEFLAAVNVAIVGVHFLPLAHVFRVPRYYALGALFCGVGIATAAAVVAGAARGDLPFILPGLLLPPGTWMIAAANVREACALAHAEEAAHKAEGDAAATMESG
jgi:hypothetical protein